MNVGHELVKHNLSNEITSILHEPLTESNETKVVANLHVRQEIAQDTIDNTTFHESDIKQEIDDIKHELPDSCAAGGSLLEEQLFCKVEIKEESNFVEHRTHTEQLYTSPICEYETAGKCTLFNRVKMLTGEKPYLCSFCEYKAAKKDIAITISGVFISVIMMDGGRELVEYNLPDALTSMLHEPRIEINENKVLANLHVRQEIAQGTIDNTACPELDFKQEIVDIKDELLDPCAASGSLLEEQLVCKAEIKDKSNFLEHLTHTEQFYVTPICKYKTAGKYTLVNQVKMLTGEKPYSCSACTYTAAQKSHLVNHMKTHTGENPYSCLVCKYKTACKGALDHHMIMHTSENPYSCSICKYEAPHKDALVNHVKTHIGKKPYFCSICDYNAARKDTIVEHMRRHTGEKPYSCSFCNYKAARRSTLRKHMKTHTGEKLYLCSICDYKTVYNWELVHHTKKHT